MNGAHDMGGVQAFGAIDVEVDEPVFHAGWEKQIFAMTLAAGAMGKWNIDKSRHARENQPPGQYLSQSYYQIWLHCLESLLVETGLVTAKELAAGKSAQPLPDDLRQRVLTAEQVPVTMARGDNFRMDDDIAAQFNPGDKVKARNIHPRGHTRLPGYIRGHAGVVDRDHGVFVFADANAAGNKVGQHCYSVKFSARELWGNEASVNDCVYADLWDDHLEQA